MKNCRLFCNFSNHTGIATYRHTLFKIRNQFAANKDGDMKIGILTTNRDVGFEEFHSCDAVAFNPACRGLELSFIRSFGFYGKTSLSVLNCTGWTVPSSL